MKKMLMLAVAAVVCWATGAMAYDFSADVVSTAEGRSFTGKMYVSGEKTRMDMAGATTITRMDKKITWVIMPGQNMYMEQPFDPEKIAGAAEKLPGEIERTLIGPDMVNGKSANKYRIRYASAQGEAVVLQWIDPQMNIPVKTAAVDGKWSVEYRNLKVGAQPNDLFEIPAGYQKFAIPNMQDMMRAAGRTAPSDYK